MNKQSNGQLAEAYVKGLQQKNVQIPALLLKYYRQLQLTELDAMIVIQCMSFEQLEDKEFPTLEELQSRLSAEPAFVIDRIREMVQKQLISIDERIDTVTGLQSEAYNFDALFKKLFALEWRDKEKNGEAVFQPTNETNLVENQTSNSKPLGGVSQDRPDKKEENIFTIFEKEFGRPLSPLECETISNWLDHDQYSLQLIVLALKEAVFSGKVSFRYIDRILLDWNRNRIYTVEQAREHAKRFRSR